MSNRIGPSRLALALAFYALATILVIQTPLAWLCAMVGRRMLAFGWRWHETADVLIRLKRELREGRKREENCG